MWKKIIVPSIFALCYLCAAVGFWYFLQPIYSNPFIWTKLDYSFNLLLLPVGGTIIAMLLFSSLLNIFKPTMVFSHAAYVVAAAIQFVFVPLSIPACIAAVIFIAGFSQYERTTSSIFHSYIKIKFWDTYTRSIPTIMTALAFVFALGLYQASTLTVQDFKIEIQRQWIEQALDLVTSSNGASVQGVSIMAQTPSRNQVPLLSQSRPIAQSQSQPSPEPAETSQQEFIEQYINQQLDQLGITDPTQREIIKQQVRQQLEAQVATQNSQHSSESKREAATGGVVTGSNTSTGSANTPKTASGSASPFQQTPLAPVSTNALQDQYRELLISQTMQQLDAQFNTLINQYRPYLPFVSGIVGFIFFSILNLPVAILSILLVFLLMNLLKALKIISIVQVKMEVERLAW
jgi:hypothetical protein